MEGILFSNSLLDRLAGLEKKKFLLSVRILKYLYFQGYSPVADICRHLKISTPNGIAILGDLMERDLIEKKGYGASKGGRKPELYGLCDDAFYVLGVDVNVHRTQLTVFNSNNERISKIGGFDLTLNNDHRTADVLVEGIEKYLEEAGIDRNRIIGTGVSFPGLVDAPKGENYTYLNFEDKPIAEFLQEKLQLPVFVENDAKAVALAVWRFGVARQKRDVLVLFLDWGIGLGMILNGKLYRGDSGFAGEFSHIPMVEDGESCICGKNGCLETVASGSALVRRAREGIIEGKSSLMSHYADENRPEDVHLQTVVNAALNGDQFAIHLLSDIGEYLGKGIAILIQLFNPGMIVMGGKMAEAGHFLTIPVQQSINTYSMHQINDCVTIQESKMGKDIVLNGAMSVVMEDVFDLLARYPAKSKSAVN